MNEDEYWALLLLLEPSWRLASSYDSTTVILINAHGQEVHANTLQGALQGALALSGGEDDTYRY